MTVRTPDTYEAAFYLMNGGVITQVEFRRLDRRLAHKNGFAIQYVVTLEQVDPEVRRHWKEHWAVVNVRQYASARLGLKRKIEKLRRSHEVAT